MDTSSGSDSYDRTRGHRPRGREAHRRAGRDRVGAGGDRATDICEKIDTLASTLQGTSRNLTKVDRMLGQYRDHTDDHAEAMALLRENLEESISQLQTQRLSRTNGARSASASASTLHTSDLEAGSGSEGQRFYPTSPLRDYTGSTGRRKRSQSAGVRFKKDATRKGDGIHSINQSLRDLQSDQLRLSDDLDREILRRNRTDIDTRRAMESLTGHLTTSQRQDSVSSHVERRLQELEREMHSEETSTERERRPQQRAGLSDELQETVGRRQLQVHERDEAMAARLLKAEKEKMEQDLERARRRLEQSEDSRESLVQQVENMRDEMLRISKEKTELHRMQLDTSQHTAQTHGNHTDRAEGRGGQRGPDLEKEVADLRVQLCKASVLREVEELKRALDHKEKERVQLSLHVEELSSDLARREQQQLRILEQLKQLQSREQAERREMEALLQESTRSRDELKTRAQEAVRQWRAKCKRLQKEQEEAKAQAQFHTDKASQAAREKENSQAQLKALSQHTEAARRELTEILGRLAQREEELHRKDVELSETRQRQLSLEQEMREVREASAAREEETRRQSAIQTRLKEENQRLEERVDSQARHLQRDKDKQEELQAALKRMTSAHSHQAQRLAEEERTRKELQKGASEQQANLTTMQEEREALAQQLQLEREVHQKEVDNLKAMMEDVRKRKHREMQAQLKEFKEDAASDKELCGCSASSWTG
ncbi:unnamed protein product [Pleuronectes platessa]|uniref:Centrosomal protein 128 n=1 Tax=Pleuronectes platessa TaxID=8262 RepID=A0A9N7VDS5_PLEPL|nr:unnamed protein product [Pleuronectes platessa]